MGKNWLDPSGLSKLGNKLRRRIDDARVAQRPVAFVHDRKGIGLSGLGLRIGRYEPIFNNAEFSLPEGLIDFIVSNSDPEISLAGIAELNHFEELQSVLTRSGFPTRLDRSAILPV